ncbi:MAG: aldo/keto reductase [Clostridia bacterium]|nr:aldo/keto reductase [Clostridia bacterium]
MIYRKVCGEKISLLGMGTMRLPTVNGERSNIDKEKAEAIIDRVYSEGVNYFDTAYMYHDGYSERFLGEAMAKYPRESYYLADKMPGMMLGKDPTAARVGEIFEEQLSRCRTEYFDFYLLHCLTDKTKKFYLDKELNIVGYLLEQKRLGRIRHFGFSSHASPETLREFIDAFPEGTFEFVQIQFNYLDTKLQRADEQFGIITSHGLPVWVMEPCRGGRLASLCPEADKLLLEKAPDRSVASWAFRYVGSMPEVGVILSGMTEKKQADDNLNTFGDFKPLDEEEKAVLEKAAKILLDKVSVPCTACRYCAVCPQELDIPGLLADYNEYKLSTDLSDLRGILKLPPEKRPESCIGCGACASVCPQGIAIPDVMAELCTVLRKLEEKTDK